MYKLQEKEQLFFTDNKHAIPAVKVECDCEKTIIYKALGAPRVYPAEKIGICHLDDDKDDATTILDSIFSIINFHQKLYECGILVDNVEDFE